MQVDVYDYFFSEEEPEQPRRVVYSGWALNPRRGLCICRALSLLT